MTADHPEDWEPKPTSEDIDRVLELIDQEAATHNAEYAAGMRNARTIVETELDY